MYGICRWGKKARMDPKIVEDLVIISENLNKHKTDMEDTTAVGGGRSGG